MSNLAKILAFWSQKMDDLGDRSSDSLTAPRRRFSPLSKRENCSLFALVLAQKRRFFTKMWKIRSRNRPSLTAKDQKYHTFHDHPKIRKYSLFTEIIPLFCPFNARKVGENDDFFGRFRALKQRKLTSSADHLSQQRICSLRSSD